jgi:hypothetical protein
MLRRVLLVVGGGLLASALWLSVAAPAALAQHCVDAQCRCSAEGKTEWDCGGGNSRCVSCCQCFACAEGTTACGFACCAPGQTCADAASSRCECPPGMRSCGGSCADLRSDPNTCGSCGTVCKASENATPICSNGACGFTCNPGFTRCEDNCVNLTPNPSPGAREEEVENCGQCGNECDGAPEHGTNKCFALSRPRCERGECCGFVCNQGFSNCSTGGVAECADLGTDPDNCGSCHNACSSDETCIRGACVSVQGCPAGSSGQAGQCQPCSPGTFSTAGSASCTPCPVGTFAQSAGSRSCTDSPRGSFVSTVGAAAPTPCPPGTFARLPASTSCTACPPDTTSGSGARSCVRGAVLCSDIGFGGTCQNFVTANPSLVGTRVGNDTVSSIRMTPQCNGVTLCSDVDFGGVCQNFTSDNPDLRGSRVGNDTASSIKLGGSCLAVRLCTDANFGGVCQDFISDNADLRNSIIGNDTASAASAGELVVSVGSSTLTPSDRVVSLYSDINFDGICLSFTGAIPFLGATAIGNDTVSSLHLGQCICKPGKPCSIQGGSLQEIQPLWAHSSPPR